MKSTESRLRALEAQSQAHAELLKLGLVAIMSGDSDSLRRALHDATLYSGPSSAMQSFARAAKEILEISRHAPPG